MHKRQGNFEEILLVLSKETLDILKLEEIHAHSKNEISYIEYSLIEKFNLSNEVINWIKEYFR